ncbi:MAG: serine/threonine-protein kinase [Phycisphaerales bacterium]|nr:serine/threonine-protein kinase [Phycisphaerales bacterium]
MSDRVDPVRALFDSVIGLDEAQRRRVLDSRRSVEPETVGEVEALLGFCDQSGVLDESPVELGARLDLEVGQIEEPSAAISPGTRVGAYEIVRLIGMGGMGVVYEAMQEMPRRRVALKLVRSEVGSRALMRRFEHEAAALALLQHPGIAQVYQAGTAMVDGKSRGYIAMELAFGKPITTHARSAHLPLRQILEVTADVCDAVQHAHQRGVIHRDLKPGNIIVSDSGEPKVLDFGIARLTGENAMMTLSTSVGQIVGTLGYMSPEQALGDPSKIDTRTDVYALGVILYEMICGKRPIGENATSVTQALSSLSNESPAAPSVSVPECRGDIDVIVLRALEKNPERRYQSPGELAEDIRRHLKGQAIEARRDSTAYVLSRQLKRYRALVIVGAAAMVAVAGFGVYAWRQSVHARGLAARLERELSVSRVERGRLQLVAGQPVAAELGLWTEWLPNSELKSAQWALRELSARTGFGAGWAQTSPGYIDIASHRSGASATWFSILAERTGELYRLDPDPALRGPKWTMKLDRGVQGLAISDDGRRIVALVQGDVVVIDAATGEVMSKPPIKLQASRTVRAGFALSGDGEVIHGWASRDEIAAWSLADGRELARASMPMAQYQAMTRSPDGKVVVALGGGDEASAFEARTLKPIGRFEVPAGARAAAFIGDGSRLIVGANKVAAVVDPAEWKTVARFEVGSQATMCRTLDERRVLLMCTGGPMILDVERGVEWSVPFSDSPSQSVAPGPLPGTLMCVPNLRSVRLLWPEASDAQRVIGQLGRPTIARLAVSPDDRLVVVWSGTKVAILRTDGPDAASSGFEIPRRSPGARWCAFSPDGKLLGVLSEGLKLVLHSTEDWSVRGEIRPKAGSNTFLFTPDGTHVIVGGIDGTVSRFVVATGEPAGSVESDKATMTPMGFVDDGQTLVVSAKSERPMGWQLLRLDARTLEVRSRVTQNSGTIRGALDRVGGRVITMEGPRLRVLGASDGVERAMFTGLGPSQRSLDVSADGRVVFASSAEGLSVYDIERAAPVFQLPTDSADPLMAVAPLHKREGVVMVFRGGRVVSFDFQALDQRLADASQLMVNQLADRAGTIPDFAAFSAWGARVKNDPEWTLKRPASAPSTTANASEAVENPSTRLPEGRATEPEPISER